MPPVGKLLKNDGPACRVCGCTEHNACVTIEMRPHPLMPKGRKRFRTAVPCSWVKVEGATPPLCSACSGTPADLAEAMVRSRRMLVNSGSTALDFVVGINAAALARYRKRQKGA